ncbi:polysaccharide pyruvyl transferase family protein [Mycobacterium sp. AMU20-3851]|uniref:polysaccharide pyruvyl transferase family protein n=1 Tax=Mycobacterium sp. AMU20-3851 TaxID=3122055 RepID=UPI00375462EA
MRKVALHGSYFGYNFGDTLLCGLFRQWIHSSSDSEVVLPLASRRNTALIGADARGIGAFLGCSDLVFCGGGYFGGPAGRSVRWSIRNFFRHFVIAELAMFMRKKVYILGCGAGPISSGFLRNRLRVLAEYSERVIVRDDESRDFLVEIGVTRPIDVDVDAAMYMDRSFFKRDVSEPVAPVPDSRSDAKVVVVHLTDFEAPYWEAMAAVVADFCNGRRGIQTVLITDSVTRTRKLSAQEKSVERLSQLIPTATKVAYRGDPTDLCQVLDAADLVITNKLHVGIVSIVLGKSVISLPQHVKTPRFYRQLDLSSVCLVDNQPEGLGELLGLWEQGKLPRAVPRERENVYLASLRPLGVAN